MSKLSNSIKQLVRCQVLILRQHNKEVLLRTYLCSLTQVQRVHQHCGTDPTITAILTALGLFLYIHCLIRTCLIFLATQDL